MPDIITALLSASLLFYAGYDRSFDADYSAGSPQATVITDRYPPTVTTGSSGRFGEAVSFSYGELDLETVWTHDVIRYEADGTIPYDTGPFDGTIGMWIRVDLDSLMARELIWLDPFHLLGPGSREQGKLWMDIVTRELDGAPLMRFGATLPVGKRTNPENSGEGHVITLPDIPFGDNEWHHLAGTWRNFNSDDGSGIIRLYIDGRPVAEVTGVCHPVRWDMATWEFRVGLAFSGLIDEVFVTGSFLTPGQADAIYHADRPLSAFLGH